MQFAVFRASRNRDAFPYVLVVQYDATAHLKSRIVVPFMALKKFGKSISRLNPTFTIEGTEMVMVTHLMGAVPPESLQKQVTDLSSHRAEIIGALDMLFTGF